MKRANILHGKTQRPKHCELSRAPPQNRRNRVVQIGRTPMTSLKEKNSMSTTKKTTFETGMMTKRHQEMPILSVAFYVYYLILAISLQALLISPFC